MNNTNFVNVCNDCVAYLEDPDPAWANPTDCGNFTCTYPNNIFIKFNNATGLPAYGPNFKVIHTQVGTTNGFNARSEVLNSNIKSTYLNTTSLAQIAFESLDIDNRN
jgi:hypothetical protein